MSYLQKRWARIDREFGALWKHYLLQSLLAAVVTLVVFWLLSAEQAVIVASIGSTAFIVFSMPSSPTAKPRRVIGGHFLGFISGLVGTLILHYLGINPVIAYALTVGISIFLMVALDMEHPPASGTALGVAIGGFSLRVMIAILTSALVLALAHHFTKKYLRDLV